MNEKITSFSELFEVVVFQNLDKELSKEVQKQEERKLQVAKQNKEHKRKGLKFTRPKPRLHGFAIHRISPKKDFQRSMYKKNRQKPKN